MPMRWSCHSVGCSTIAATLYRGSSRRRPRPPPRRLAIADLRATLAVTPNSCNSIPATTLSTWSPTARQTWSRRPRARCCPGSRCSIRRTISTVCWKRTAHCSLAPSAAKDDPAPTARGDTCGMDLTATLDAPCAAGQLFELVDDLSTYPQWNGLVHAAAREPDADAAWDVELRARVG